MKKCLVVFTVLAIFFAGLTLGFVENAIGAPIVEVKGPSTISWGQEAEFDIEVKGRADETVILSPFLWSESGDFSHTFIRDGEVWKVHVTIPHDAYMSGGPMEDIIRRSRIPGYPDMVFLVFQGLKEVLPDGGEFIGYIPVSNPITVRGVPRSVQGDITSEDIISRNGYIRYDKSDNGKLKLNKDISELPVFNNSVYVIEFALNGCDLAIKDKAGLERDNERGKYILLSGGGVLFHINSCSVAYNRAKSVASYVKKGECRPLDRPIQVGTITVMGYNLPINVNIDVCYKVDNSSNDEDDGGNDNNGSEEHNNSSSASTQFDTDCSSISSVLLDNYENSGVPFIASPIGKACLIVFDGHSTTTVKTDAPATIKNGRTLLPMRFFLEALGAKLWWIPKDKKVVVVIPQKPDETDSYRYWESVTKIEMWIGYGRARVNGGVYDMPSGVPPQIIYSRTYVPLRFIGEMTGWQAEWDGDSRVAVIHR